MSNAKIKQLLHHLREEIGKTKVDAQTQALMNELDKDIHELIDPAYSTQETGLILERAKLLEARFASSHPAAEGFLRELVETLGRLGI